MHFLQQSPLYVFWTFAFLWDTSLHKCVRVSVHMGCKRIAEGLFFPLSSARVPPAQRRGFSPSSQARCEEYKDPAELCCKREGCLCCWGSRDHPSGRTEPWSFAFVTCPLLFLNAVFFTVKWFEGWLDMIMICYGSELGPKLEWF